ncbi:MAG TPA: bifunctional diguanylate cyclase/phosphodiesterase [Xanthobacteraceae bacterium]|nr:bifunctional diguanylate cyclase/phosphodiesterase [Xanthobacteraceae bacterium]
MILALAVIACAAAGWSTAQHDEARRLAEGHRALDAALGEFRPDNTDHFDKNQLAQIERRTGLGDLRFDADLGPDSRREVQSLHDAQGRIIGWLSWAPDRALVQTMDWLWGLAGVSGILLALGAALVLGATKRLNASLHRSAETVRKLTTQDPLTGLANRRVLLQRLDDTMAARRNWDVVVVALLDIDGFHDINDMLGWAGGDTMLLNIVERLKAVLPEGALLARYQDDEFAVVLGGGHAQSANELADRVTTALAAPIFMDQMWQVSASIGLAQAPDDGTTGDELIRRAALALRAAKRAGRGTVRRFVPQIQEEHSERRFFLRELETAIRDDAFEVHYQPVVAAEGGAVVGVEALLRWTHPTRGPLSPAVFIPLAEESGLMVELGDIALKRALKDGARWPDLFVSVNLSPVQMRSRALVPRVASVLGETGMPASRVVLEVTEGILIDNPEETQLKLEALRSLGVSTALDDFGTGYSSLNYLQKFPFDRLKIDRSFVASLGTAGNSGAIVQSIVTLGHALGMKVLAEGVETNEQRVLLRLAGCDEMQGFLFAKACPAESIDKILSRVSAARAARRADSATA